MIAILSLLAAIPNTIFRGFVLVQLYNWFILDVWSDAPHMSKINAIGISYIAQLLTAQLPADDDSTMGESLFKGQVFAFILTLLAWGVGAFLVSLR